MAEDPSDSNNILWKDGYAVSVVGFDHQQRTETESLVEMPRNVAYKLRLTNANDHICMCKLELDGIEIGTFLLHEYTYCYLERPADRPLCFMFCMPESPTSSESLKNVKNGNERKRSSAAEQLGRSRTNVTCVFMPEAGSRTLQFDVRCDIAGRTQRLEMANECSALELFTELERDFGEESTQGPAAIIHWTSAEYDSPVDDVLTPEMHVALRNCKRKDDTLRKMCLIKTKRLTIAVDEDGLPHSEEIELDHVPTFADVFSVLKDMGFKDQRIWYFTSSAGRLIGSSDWVQSSLFICQLLHRDEVLLDPDMLTIHATSLKPNQCCSVFARVLNDTIHELVVSLDMTIREIRHQLAARGGPWGEDPKWLYGGTLLENGNALQRYGIRGKDTIDIVLRLRDQGSTRPLVKREPVVVETEVEVETACLIRKEVNPANATVNKKRASQGQVLARGGTCLKGRSSQQFVEVDPIEVDDRFFINLLVSMVPDDDILLETDDDDDPEKNSKACCLM